MHQKVPSSECEFGADNNGSSAMKCGVCRDEICVFVTFFLMTENA